MGISMKSRYLGLKCLHSNKSKVSKHFGTGTELSPGCVRTLRTQMLVLKCLWSEVSGNLVRPRPESHLEVRSLEL